MPLLSAECFPQTHIFVKRYVSQKQGLKSKVHGEDIVSPRMEHVCIIYMLEFYVFM